MDFVAYSVSTDRRGRWIAKLAAAPRRNVKDFVAARRKPNGTYFGRISG